jgi:hypothetical protein
MEDDLMEMTELDLIDAPINENEAAAAIAGFGIGLLAVAAFAALC